ncbi:MAG: ABC-2 family transporter protein [Dehalococcoidales bacterium]|nr:MAG: ABC-2 family transporter protein [Dehalococcoidales bacterium]
MDNLIDSIQVYFKLIGINIRSQLQYRSAFIMMLLGNFAVTFIEFIGIVVLFTRFGTIQGWRLEEVAMFYGIINVGYAVSEAFGRGFDHFHLQVIHGEFDRTLLRPRSTALQVLAHDFLLLRAGRLLQGLVILIWASVNIGIAWNIAKVLLLFVSLIGNVCVFTGLLILQATMCFWSTQGLEVMNSFTYGGVETVQWPLPIFKKWFAGIFVFIIPLACVNYFPALAIMGKSDPLNTPIWFQWLSPLIGLLFLWISLKVWKFGVRHYHSTGS